MFSVNSAISGKMCTMAQTDPYKQMPYIFATKGKWWLYSLQGAFPIENTCFICVSKNHKTCRFWRNKKNILKETSCWWKQISHFWENAFKTITELLKRHIYTIITSASICSCLKYLGYILKDEEKLFLLVFLLTKTCTVVGEVWIQMTKRIKRQIKEVNFSDLNDVSHLASKNFQVLQAALCLPWRGKKTQNQNTTTHIKHS